MKIFLNNKGMLLLQESRNTRQKDLILNCLKQNASKHLTIGEIKRLLNKTGSYVGTATIYRQLGKLAELNIVRKFKFDGQNSACFQYIKNTDKCCEHFHLICSVCSKTLHFQDDNLIKVFEEINRKNSFKIDFPKTVFYGICNKCISKKFFITSERR